jgi:hypothetical protein
MSSLGDAESWLGDVQASCGCLVASSSRIRSTTCGPGHRDVAVGGAGLAGVAAAALRPLRRGDAGGGREHLLGGVRQSLRPRVFLGDLWVFHFATHTWRELPPSGTLEPGLRFTHAAAVAVNEHMYVSQHNRRRICSMNGGSLRQSLNTTHGVLQRADS